MKLPFFYISQYDGTQKEIVLDEDTSKHVVQVLRMKSGEQMNLTDGKGHLLTCAITDDNKKHCAVEVKEKKCKEQPARKVSIAISLLKNTNRFEWFLEKATEIGVSEIIPLICERTEKEKFRYERLQGIVISAMLQSQQVWLPVLQDPVEFSKAVLQSTATQKFIAHCEEGKKQELAHQELNQSAHQLIYIGPEGDFTKEEIAIALQNNFIPVALGETRLRTETAGVVAAVILLRECIFPYLNSRMPASLNVYTKSLFLLAGILFPDIINAQSGSIFHHLTAEQGLASNRCNSILQDSEGYYWIATDDGLSRFDGTHCKNYRKNANDSLSLSNNLSYNLLEDKQGNIWIGTYQGINRYNKKTGKFTRYYLSHPGISPGYNNIVRSVDMDKEGNIWVAAGGLWCFNVSLQEWTLFENSKEDNYSIPAGTVIQVAFDRQLNGIWALAGQRFAFYNIRQKKFYSTPEHTQQSKLFEYTGIINFTIEEGKGIWFSTHQENGGLFFYDSRLNSINKKMLLEGKGLRKMSLDNNGKLWLHFFARKTLILDTKTNSIDSSFLSNVHDQSALSEESNNLYIDKAGCYWIGSPTGINIYNPAIQAIAITSFLDGNEIGHKKFEIRDIVQKDSFSYFVATTLGIFSYIPGQQLSLRKLPFAGELHTDKLFLTTDDILWYAAEGKIYCYDLTRKRLSKTLTVESKVQSIINGNNGLIYVATWTKGLYVLDREGILKEHLTASVGEKLRYDWIICAVLSRNKKYIWIGYNGGKGFSKFCISDGSVSHYTVTKMVQYG